jgi:hypothetical protein
VRRIARFVVLLAIIFAVFTPQAALAQTAPEGPAIEVFIHGHVPEEIQARYVAAIRSSILFAHTEFGQMPLAVVRLRLYENEALFAQGLIDIVGLSEEMAKRFAGNFVGAAIERDVLIMVRIDPARHRLSSQLIITDELLHLLQSSWAGSVHRIPSWMSNGQAFFYAAMQVERIAGPHAADFYRSRAIAALRERRDDLPTISLMKMRTSLEWVEAFERYGMVRGWSISYSYAFLAYEYLERITSVQTVLDYFTRLRDGMSSDDAFLAAFGMSKTDFDARFREHVRVLVGQP